MYLDFKNGFSLLLIFVSLVFGIILFKKYIQFYLKFPNRTALLIVLRWIWMTQFNKSAVRPKSPIEMLYDECNRIHKEGICVYWLDRPLVFLCNEASMRVFNNDQCVIGKIPEYNVLKEGFGVSLITAPADIWKIRRKMLNPAFRTPVLKHHVPMLNESAILLVNKLMNVPNETPVRILRYLQSCTFANIYEFLSGDNLNDPQKILEMENAIDELNAMGKFIGYRIWRPWLYPKTILKFVSEGRKYLTSLNNLQAASKKVLLEMEESVLSSKKENDMKNIGIYGAPKSFAQHLIEQKMKNPEFTFQDMHDEMNGLAAAGFDTVSYSLMWSLFILGHHSEIQEKLFDEIESFMAGELTFDDLKHLPYLDCVIKEVLRLYPPVPMYGKKLVKDMQYGKHTFPKGTNLVFFPYVVHRDPSYYPEPEKFYPERFLEKDVGKKPETYAFSEGVRSCIGKQFALMEMKIVLAHVIKNFKVTSLDRKEDVRITWEIVLTTEEPLRMKFCPRRRTETHG